MPGPFESLKSKLCFSALLIATLFVSVAGLRAGSASPADARTEYNRKCVSCHGRDGRGQTRRGRRARTRDLTNAEWHNDVSDERLFNSINNGRNKMPAFKKLLSESEIDALVDYVRHFRR